MRCTFCGRHGHTQANCPRTWDGQTRRFHMRCNYCGGRDHNQPACPKTMSGSANRRWRPRDVEDEYVTDR